MKIIKSIQGNNKICFNDYIICIMYIHQKDCSFLLDESLQNIVLSVPIDILKTSLQFKNPMKVHKHNHSAE